MKCFKNIKYGDTIICKVQGKSVIDKIYYDENGVPYEY